ncbi:MAG: hypothetical protein ACREIS_02110 [Nitrospiraceae bacterium]
MEIFEAGRRGTRNKWMIVIAVVLIIALSGLGQVSVAWSQTGGPPPGEDTTPGTPSGAGLQAASWLLTVPYGAAKVAFALLGGIVGGLTWALSGGNTEAAKSVWTTSIYGTYVITPDHLRGDKPIRFLGVPAESDNAGAPVPVEPAPVSPAPAK